MRRIVVIALVLASCAPLSACGSSSPSSPKAVRASIVAAALAQNSVHWNERAIDAVISARWISDVNAHSGKQRVTLEGGTFAGGEAQIRLINGIVYVRGNPKGLRYTLDLTGAQPRRYAGKWISIPKGDNLYAETAAGLTLRSIVRDVTPQQLKLARKKAPRPRLLVLQGWVPGHIPYYATLSVRSHGEPLPVAGFERWDPYGHELHRRFSEWHEPVHVQAPASSTPIATVRKG